MKYKKEDLGISSYLICDNCDCKDEISNKDPHKYFFDFGWRQDKKEGLLCPECVKDLLDLK